MSAKKIIILILVLVAVCSAGISVFIFFKNRQPTAGLRVDSTPNALVFVNNKEMGLTPIEAYFPPGEVSVKIVPESGSESLGSYQTKVKLTDKFITVISREFGATDAESAGEIISLQSQSGSASGLAVVTSSPNSASVTVNGQSEGFTPLLMNSIAEGQHQIVLTAPGYKPKTINAKVVSGHKLTVNAKLAALPVVSASPTATESSTMVATGSASLSPTPVSTTSPTPTKSSVTATPSPSPKATPTPTPSLPKPYVQILETPTGFLRVRSGPGKNFSEVGQVNPKQLFPLLDKDGEWLNIKVDLSATNSGWISAEYAKKFE